VLVNMFQKLIDCITRYQSTYIKHDDAVIMTGTFASWCPAVR
jgi:hypothetical protein